jgi:NAD(P)-dependent dehydrogenase (short-subunit alcohol dehydrogenase family)
MCCARQIADMTNPFDLSGKMAVVTGAANGIGRAIALGLARQGADIAACDIDEAGVTRTIDEVTALGRRGLAMHCDVEQPAQIADFFAAVDDTVGGVDILVNNVGHVARTKPEDLTLDRWNWVLTTGVTASLLCAQEAGRRMMRTGRGGSIINISSIAGATALGRGNLSHSMNKGAIHQLTRELAVEWAKHGIRVNAILPCQVLTEGFQSWLDSPDFDPALMDRFLTGIPMNRLARPEDIAGPAIFLASDAAAMVTGTLLPVDGGNLALNAGGSHTW